MVELGDLREGIMPADLLDCVRETLTLQNIDFKGIGTNLACRSGVSPDARNMAKLSELAELIESTFELDVETVSGGNSANLQWALSDAAVGRINDLRLGEAILLGCETLHRQALDGLHTDAITLVAEVIEAKVKPSLPTGQIAQNAFGEIPVVADRGPVTQVILALGRQDTDPDGLQAPDGINVMGGSSDHLILECDSDDLLVGTEVAFQMNYSALVRAMTSPYVTKVIKNLL
jgi:predicted amino acid racemase